MQKISKQCRKYVLNVRQKVYEHFHEGFKNNKEWIGFLIIIFSKITFMKKLRTRACGQRVPSHVTFKYWTMIGLFPIILKHDWSVSTWLPIKDLISEPCQGQSFKNSKIRKKLQRFQSKILENEKNVRHCLPWSENRFLPLLVTIQQDPPGRTDSQDCP